MLVDIWSNYVGARVVCAYQGGESRDIPPLFSSSSPPQTYGRDLLEAFEWCKKYQSTNNARDLTQAWELYYNVFRRIYR